MLNAAGLPLRFLCALTLCALVPTLRAQAPVAAEHAEQTRPLSLRAAADYSKSNKGLAVLVYRDGERIFEEYHNGHKAGKAQHIYSGTKSFAPVVALIAEAEGLLSLDEAASETIEEWRDDERRAAITIRQLLNFTSGLKVNDREMHSPLTRNKYASAIACEAAAPPGKRFKYGSCHLMAFGELFNRKLRASDHKEKDFVAYLKARVLDPIGCKFSYWLRDGKKNPALPYGAFFTAREWAKFGQLLLDSGRHDEKQLIPAKGLKQCFVGSKANPIYGLNFWLVGKRARRAAIPKDTYSAAGMYKQRLFVIPSERLVIVRFGQDRKRTRFDDQRFLSLLFTKAAPATKTKNEAALKNEDGLR